MVTGEPLASVTHKNFHVALRVTTATCKSRQKLLYLATPPADYGNNNICVMQAKRKTEETNNMQEVRSIG